MRRIYVVLVVEGIVTFFSLLPLFNIIMVWTFTGVLSNLLWFLPGTFGVRELALTVLISQFVDTPTALVASILLRILLMGYQLIFGSFVLLLFLLSFLLSLSLSLSLSLEGLFEAH